MSAYTFVYVAMLLAMPAAATEGRANPMEKVIELLEVLSKGIRQEGKEEAESYEAQIALYKKDSSQSKEVIKENDAKISRLTTDLKEAEAFREGKNKDMTDLANKLAKNDAELTAGRDGRKEERALFEKNEAVFVESLDQLERSLVVMKKQAPSSASAAASSASLISVAEKLKKTLTHASDFTLTTAQREILNNFMRTAYVLGDFKRSVKQASSPVPFFLQRKSQSNGPYGEFESGSGGVLSTLKDLQGKVTKERETALKKEAEAKKDFEEFESGLTQALENGKKSLADIKAAIAQSQQVSSQKEASLMEAQEIYKSEVEHLSGLEQQHRQRTEAYKIRLSKRADEATAVTEAQRILGSEMAKSVIKKQTIGSSLIENGASSLLQVTLEKTAVWSKVSRTRPTGLAFMEMSATIHRKSIEFADPFQKVKSMIKSMLSKLEDKQNQESKHAAFCDKEMGKTSQQLEKKGDDVQKTQDRLDALVASLSETKSDMEDVSKDLKDVTASMNEANALREKESKTSLDSIRQFRNAALLLNRAIKVLKTYYQKKSKKGPEGKGAKQREGMGSGIIAILEIAVDDFEKLHKDSKQAEDLAAKEFQQFQSETETRVAIFKKDLEWKTRTKVKLEYDESTMRNDLKSYEKELAAINTYMDKLKASCVVQGPSYEERKSKREEELKSLKEALATLSSH